MSVKFSNYLFHSINRVRSIDKTNGLLIGTLEDITNATMENGSEVVYATGKNGVNLASFDRNKTSRISGTNATITDGLLAVQLGSEVTIGDQEIPNYLDLIILSDGAKAKLTYAPVGAAGAEIIGLYRYNEGGIVLSEVFSQAAEASATEFAFDPATKEITLPTDAFKAGESIVVQYNYQVKEVKSLVNRSDAFAKTVRVEVECYVRNICDGKDYECLIVYPSAKADGNFSIEFGDTPATHAFAFDAMVDYCSPNKELFQIYIFDNSDAVA